MCDSVWFVRIPNALIVTVETSMVWLSEQTQAEKGKRRCVHKTRITFSNNNGYCLCVEPCAGRAAPPPTFVDRRAAADNLSARSRCHFCCVLILLQFSIDRWLQKSSENFEARTKIFPEPLKLNFLAANAAPRRPAPPPIFWTVGAPPTKIDRGAAADTMTSAQGSICEK